MMKNVILILSTILLLAGCSPRLATMPDKINFSFMTGEAIYLQTRCPQYKVGDMDKAAKAHIVITIIANRGNLRSLNADTFLQQTARDLVRGMRQAQIEFAGTPINEVCKIAFNRYGPNGSKAKNLLMRNRKSR